MPNYFLLNDPRKFSGEDKNRTSDRLIKLKAYIESTVPKKTLDDNLLLATWNIREFDSAAYGDRLEEAILYIAEIISHFDLVAVQEVRDNLKGLDRLKLALGKWWDVIYTDVTEGHKGNNERLVYLYDTRKVVFTGLAGEIVIPDKEEKDKEGKKLLKVQRQLARTPFLVGFKSGWFNFMLCTVHIIYGESKSDSKDRIDEIRALVDFMANRTDRYKGWYNNLILLGDFNIFKPENETFQVIAEKFNIPKQIRELPANIPQNKHYDQIAFRLQTRQDLEETKAGIIKYYDHVFKEEDENIYAPFMGSSYQTSNKKERTAKSKTSYYKTYWRTHQMSDHYPMWVEIKTDFSTDYLNKRMNL